MLVVLVAAFPFRAVEALRGADREQASVGYSPHWQREPNGLRYRWAGARSAFFVPAAARAVRVPLRLPAGTSPIQVRFLADGREIDGALLRPGDDWRTVRLLLKPGAARFTHRSRRDLRGRCGAGDGADRCRRRPDGGPADGRTIVAGRVYPLLVPGGAVVNFIPCANARRSMTCP